MIKEGELTMIKFVTYRCIRVENGMAHLKDVTTDKGRAKLVRVEECPYIENSKLIVPEIPAKPKYKRKTTLSIPKIIKEVTDLTVSTNAKYFIAEWIETAVANLIANGEASAKNLGHKRITEAHIYWMETNDLPIGHWKSNMEYMKED